MDFAFSKDQEDFRSSLRRFLADKAPLSAVRAASESILARSNRSPMRRAAPISSACWARS